MAWTNVTKPVESSVVIGTTDAEPFGILMAITSVLSTDSSSVTSGWGNVTKPSSNTWTNVSKPSNSVWTTVIKPTS